MIRNTEIILAERKAREKGLKEGLEKGKKEGIEKGIEQGIQKGAKENSIRIAKNLLNLNINIDDISKATGLSIDEIENL